jgi:aconitate hydratase
MIAAGLLAKKAVEAGLTVEPHIKTSLAPGSRIVTEYLTRAGLLPYLEKLGFNLACVRLHDVHRQRRRPDSRDQRRDHEERPRLRGRALGQPQLRGAHPPEPEGELSSPARRSSSPTRSSGTVLKDLMTEPVGKGKKGKDVWLGDIWPTSEEVGALMKFAMNGAAYRGNYEKVSTDAGPLWEQIRGVSGQVYNWPRSTYIAEPPFFEQFEMTPPPPPAAIQGARAMALFGDSITTDHISPAGSIKEASPAGSWLKEHGVAKADFNSYGSRRGHHEVMMRGTFANVRIKNLMIPPGPDGSREEGGVTLFQPSGEKMFIYDAAMKYIAEKTPTIVFGGEEYGTGSSRDWAAKGTQLLGIQAVVARSFERIHRSNLVGMGVLPLQFKSGDSWESLGIRGDETFDIELGGTLKPQQDATLVVHAKGGEARRIPLVLRIDTPIEVDYYRHGGILPFVLRQLLPA